MSPPVRPLSRIRPRTPSAPQSPARGREPPQELREALDALDGRTREEAERLLAHALARCERGWRAPPAMVERFVLALRARGVDEAPALFARGHELLPVLDAATRIRHPRSLLQRKLLVAAAIAECDPASARALMARERSLARWSAAVARELARAGALLLAALPFLLSDRLLRRHVRF